MAKSKGINSLGNNIEKNNIIEKVEETKTTLEDLESRQKEFELDIESCEEDYNLILNSEELDNSIKLDMLRELRDKIDSVKESYYNNVTEIYEKTVQEYEETVTTMLEKAKEYEQLQKHFEKRTYKSIERDGLHNSADKIKEKASKEEQDYREMARTNSEELILRMQQYEMINRRIMRDKLSG